MKLPRIDLFLTGKCNNHCPVCYVPFPWNVNDSSTREVINLIEKLISIGLRRINLTGGEPLVRDDLVILVEYLFENNVEIYLCTNGHLLLKKYNDLSPYLKWLSLSLDSVNPEIGYKIKNDYKQVQIITGILDFFTKNPPKHGVTIGTIISKLNICDSLAIGDLLTKKSYIPDQWRIFQYCSRGPRQKNRTRQANELDTPSFLKIGNEIQSKYGHKIKINIYPIRKRSSKNILIKPDLTIAVAIKDYYKTFGSLKGMTSYKIKNLINQFQNKKLINNTAYLNWPHN